MSNIEEKLKRIKVLFLDADGVLFSGHEYRSVIEGKGVILKSRSHLDGQGISFIREMGISVVFVSGEGEPLGSVIEKMNQLPSAISGRWKKVQVFEKRNSKGDKVKAIRDFLSAENISVSDVAYMGDDVNDFEPISVINREGGLTISPVNATRRIAPITQIKTLAKGGDGAIRELAHIIIDARGLNELEFPPA